MTHYSLLAIQSSLGTALLLALLWAIPCSRARGMGSRQAHAFFGMAGILAAVALAILRRATTVNLGKITTGAAALAIIASLVFLVCSLGSLRRQTNRGAVVCCAGNSSQLALLFLLPVCAFPAVFLYPSEFLLAGESAVSTDFLFKCIGYIAGLGLSFLAGFALYKTARGMGRDRRDEPGIALRVVLGAALLVNMAHQGCAVLQFLFARRMIPMNRAIFHSITPALNNSVVFLFGIVALACVLPVLAFARSFRNDEAPRNPAEKRKAMAAKRRTRQICVLAVAAYALAIFSITVVKAWSERGVELSQAETYTLQGGEIIIPLEKIEDGHLHRYNYHASETIEMRFIVIKKNESAYGVGLDACDICGPTGYYERKDEVICRLCDVVMNKATIGFRGGCNPVPLAYTLRNGAMIIQTEHLEAERARFK